MIEDLDRSRPFGGFNQKQMMEILQGFGDVIMYEIGGERGESSREVGK